MTVTDDEAMRAEAAGIQAARPDAILATGALAPPVIVSIPADLGAVEVLVRHLEWGVEVDVRPAGTSHCWTPIQLMGGTFTVRDR